MRLLFFDDFVWEVLDLIWQLLLTSIVINAGNRYRILLRSGQSWRAGVGEAAAYRPGGKAGGARFLRSSQSWWAGYAGPVQRGCGSVQGGWQGGGSRILNLDMFLCSGLCLQ